MKKQLKEEKILRKETEGMSMGGGEVSAPSSASAPTDGITSSSKVNGITNKDIFGDCDHEHEGFFGPGCFHIPCRLFSRPIGRVQYIRPKKKHKKNYNQYEMIYEDENINIFIQRAKHILDKIIKTATEKYLKRIDNELYISILKDYEFENDKQDWVAAYALEQQNDVKELPIAINYEVLYNFLEQNEAQDDNKELELQLMMCFYHEFAHTLVGYFEDQEIYDFELSNIDEEKLCEEFANYQIKSYTEVFNSKLNNFIKEIFDN